MYIYIYVYIYIYPLYSHSSHHIPLFIYIYIYRYIDILSHKATNYSHNWYTQDDAQSRVLLQNCRRRSCRCSLCRGRRCVGIAVCARLPKAGGKGKQWKKKTATNQGSSSSEWLTNFFRLNSEDWTSMSRFFKPLFEDKNLFMLTLRIGWLFWYHESHLNVQGILHLTFGTIFLGLRCPQTWKNMGKSWKIPSSMIFPATSIYRGFSWIFHYSVWLPEGGEAHWQVSLTIHDWILVSVI